MLQLTYPHFNIMRAQMKLIMLKEYVAYYTQAYWIPHAHMVHYNTAVFHVKENTNYCKPIKSQIELSD